MDGICEESFILSDIMRMDMCCCSVEWSEICEIIHHDKEIMSFGLKREEEGSRGKSSS